MNTPRCSQCKIAPAWFDYRIGQYSRYCSDGCRATSAAVVNVPKCSQCKIAPAWFDRNIGQYSRYCSNTCRATSNGRAPVRAPARAPVRAPIAPVRAPVSTHGCMCAVCVANPRCQGAGVAAVLHYNTHVNPILAATWHTQFCPVLPLVQEFDGPYAGQYNWPCGGRKVGECIVDTARRECREELKLVVQITAQTKYIVHRTTVIFIVRVSKLKRDVLNAKVTADNANPLLSRDFKEISHIDYFRLDNKRQIEDKPSCISSFVSGVIDKNLAALLSV